VHKFCGRLFSGLYFLFRLWFGAYLLLSEIGWNFSPPVCRGLELGWP